jgi:poly(3-hydroxybutyrate) depolymerase
MVSIMLATYPEVFAGGAIIAGLPFGSARSVGDAFARMRGDGHPAPAELASLVRRASDHHGPWPTVSVWHGGADTVVDPSNAGHIVAQWQALHGVDTQLPASERIDGSLRRRWRDADGRAVIESWTIDAMGHGTPLATRGADACGKAGPFMLEAGISSTRHIARSWALLAEAKPARVSASSIAERQSPKLPGVSALPSRKANSVATVIEDALRAAGLMR